MVRPLRVSTWPLALRVPVFVAGLMIGIAILISQVVFSRLVQDQESNLRLLTSAYLDGLSAAVLPAVVRADTWEAFDVLDRARRNYAGVKAHYTVIELPSGTVLAASDPTRFPVQTPVPKALEGRFSSGDGLVMDYGKGRAWLARTLSEGGVPVGRILAEIDVADLLRVRHRVLLTLVLANGALTLGFALVGYFGLKHMLQPLAVLAGYVERIRGGQPEPIPERFRKNVGSEFGQLFDRFNAMASAVREREALTSRLAEQERYALLGRLASGMAHEVNNPLGGMLNAIDTIQAHGDDPAVLQKSLDFLKRGLAGIRNVVRAALVTYKGGANADVLTPTDLDDLPFLVQHETGARRLRLEWQNRIEDRLPMDGPAARQILLNLLLNACAASPPGGVIMVETSFDGNAVRIEVADEGPGLPPEMELLLDAAAHPAAPAGGAKGLGLWTTAHLVNRLGGRIEVARPAVGTRLTVTLPVGNERTLSDAA
jgi:signal transduction histidine kinase